LVYLFSLEWQREIATPILELALLEKEPLEIAQSDQEESSDEKSI
jgi:hypothetical protein